MNKIKKEGENLPFGFDLFVGTKGLFLIGCSSAEPISASPWQDKAIKKERFYAAFLTSNILFSLMQAQTRCINLFLTLFTTNILFFPSATLRLKYNFVSGS